MRALVFTLVAAVGVAGCSFAGVRGPRAHPRPGEPLSCTRASGLPKLDIVLGVVSFAAVTLVGAQLSHCPVGGCDHDDGGPHGDDWITGLAVGAVAAAPWVLSGIVGRDRVARCRAQHAARSAL